MLWLLYETILVDSIFIKYTELFVHLILMAPLNKYLTKTP